MQASTAALLLLALASSTALALPNKQILTPEDIVLLGSDGQSQIVKANEFNEFVRRSGLESVSTLSSRSQDLKAPSPSVERSTRVRRCDESEEVQVLSDKSFLDWDFAISPVISAQGGGASVSITQGFSLSNSISVTSTIGTSLPESILSASLSVSYQETWTTQQSQTLQYTVPDGQVGVIVSQPWVRRVEGNILGGCTDSPTKIPFVSNTYTSQQYGDLSWVRGLIRLCNSTTYPVPYCIGEGFHH